MNPLDPEKNTGSLDGEDAQRREEALMIRQCRCCKRLFAPMTFGCFACASNRLEWVPSRGAGSVRSWRVVDRAAIGGRSESAPLTIAIVELDEGPWVYTSIEGDAVLPHNRSARVRFQPRPQADRFPVFTLDAEAGGSRDQNATGHGVGDRSEDKHGFD